MAKTHAQILLGEDMEGGEVFCDDIYNYLKNHWRADYTGDPCAVLTEQLGMIISDAHDDRLYHITTGPVCTEIVQGDIPVSDEVAVILGDDSDGSIYYDEAVNNELVLEAKNAADVEGITVSLLEINQKYRIRGIAGFLGFEVTPNAPIGTNLMALWDPDFDSNIAFLWEADDKPKIDAGGNAEGIIIPVCADDDTKTDNYNVLPTDFGKTLIMNAVDKAFSLPSVGASDIGAILTFVFIGTGTLIIDAADADTIDDSGAGDTIYCTQNGEKYSTLTLMLTTATEWIILAAKGIWTTTE